MSFIALEHKLKLLEESIKGPPKSYYFIFIEGTPEEEEAMLQIAEIEKHEPNADVLVIKISGVKND
ncbi:hypothetical protein [Methanococcoides seepicolus]|uniref:Uncharacterized protein n=1 Tax=Methanococcoides seepicolus TaxID=2828780 RepID=A0A9E4ZF72_9EURY|nr:hypothetical protein [Methanococcoides seepicolus]MCM1986039.1 hypothetical protein [Methanococcoides seepicolus]